jgi:hypothetical protein
MRGLLVFFMLLLLPSLLLLLLLPLLLLLTMQPVLQQLPVNQKFRQICGPAHSQSSSASLICSCCVERQLVLQQQQVAAAAWADKGRLCVTQLLLLAAGCGWLCGGAAAAAWPVAVHAAGLLRGCWAWGGHLQGGNRQCMMWRGNLALHNISYIMMLLQHLQSAEHAGTEHGWQGHHNSHVLYRQQQLAMGSEVVMTQLQPHLEGPAAGHHCPCCFIWPCSCSRSRSCSSRGVVSSQGWLASWPVLLVPLRVPVLLLLLLVVVVVAALAA